MLTDTLMLAESRNAYHIAKETSKNSWQLNISKVLFIVIFIISILINLLDLISLFFEDFAKSMPEVLRLLKKDKNPDFEKHRCIIIVLIKICVMFIFFSRNVIGIPRFSFIRSMKLGILLLIVMVLLEWFVSNSILAVIITIVILSWIMFRYLRNNNEYLLAFDNNKLYLKNKINRLTNIYFGDSIDMDIDIESKKITLISEDLIWDEYFLKDVSQSENKNELFSSYMARFKDTLMNQKIPYLQNNNTLIENYDEIKLNYSANIEFANEIIHLKEVLSPYISLFTRENHEIAMKTGFKDPKGFFATGAIKRYHNLMDILQFNIYDQYGLTEWSIKEDSLSDFLDNIIQKLQSNTLTTGEYMGFIDFLNEVMFSIRAYDRAISVYKGYNEVVNLLTERDNWNQVMMRIISDTRYETTILARRDKDKSKFRSIVFDVPADQFTCFNNVIEIIGKLSTNMGVVTWVKKFENVEITG